MCRGSYPFSFAVLSLIFSMVASSVDVRRPAQALKRVGLAVGILGCGPLAGG